jgi:ferrochelatase
MSELSPDRTQYDALLVVSFGGPEGMDDVLPFLHNVLRGRNVPPERMREVAAHYEQFGGVSPINEQNRALIRALADELNRHGPRLPIYWGNRNWHPLLPDTVRQMRDDGIRRALAFVTSAFSSYSGCRQYLENLADARQQVGPDAPVIDKLRAFYNHPGFIAAMADRVAEALEQLPAADRGNAPLVFTAHSIPLSMAQTCDYEQQFFEASRLVASALGREAFHCVYQSRSGPPSQPWLEPDVCDFLRGLAQSGVRHVVLVPIGFVSDHMEVIYDLDTEAQAACDEAGLNMVRAATVGTHPRFVQMIRQLIEERVCGAPRLALGEFGPRSDACPADCCPAPRRH